MKIKILAAMIALSLATAVSFSQTQTSQSKGGKTQASEAKSSQQKEKKERTVYVSGNLYDSFLHTPLKARVYLMNEDSVVTDSMKTVINSYVKTSRFHFQVPQRAARFIVKAVCEGYEDGYISYDLKPMRRKEGYLLPDIPMKRRRQDDIYKDVELGDVVVHGTRIQMAYRGDTIVYDAAAFNLPEGSMLDGLVRLMPGAELKDNGDIYVNGRKVDYLTLNGKDFFKGKNNIMLENLPYFTVKEVKVYDKSTETSELMGRDVEQKDYVMDVELKREYAMGYIVNTEAGAGSNDRWMARLFGLYYGDKLRVSTFFNANNVNENRKLGQEGEWSPKKLSRGQLTTKQAGVNAEYSDAKLSLKETFDASVDWSGTRTEQRSVSQTFSTGGDIMRRSEYLSKDDDFSLSMRNMLRNQKLGIHSGVNLYYSNTKTMGMSADSTFNDWLMNSNINRTMRRYKNFRANAYISWYKPLNTGDAVMFSATASYGSSKPYESFRIDRTVYETTGDIDLRRRYTDSHSMNYSYTLSAGYRYVLPKVFDIELRTGYCQEFRSAANGNYRFDRFDNELPEQLGWLPSTRDSMMMALDADNSYFHSTLNRYMKNELAIIRSTKKGFLYFILPLSTGRERMIYSGTGLDTIARRTSLKLNPSFQYSTSGKNQFRFVYYGNLSQPSFYSLMPREDTNNPLYRRISNPDLKSEFRHKLEVRKTVKCDSIGMSYWINLDAQLVQNARGIRTAYSSATGAYTYRDDNVNGNWNAKLRYGMDGTFDKKRRLRYTLNTTVAYEHCVDFDIAYDSEASALSKVNTVNLGLGGGLKYKIDKLTVGINGKIDSRFSRSDRENFNALNVYDFRYGTNLQYLIPWVKLDIATDINMFSRRGYDSGEMNTSDLVWNAQLAHTFMKGRVTAKVMAYDILHQLSNKRYSVNAQGRTETWYNTVPRYVMFSMTYKLHVKPCKR